MLSPFPRSKVTSFFLTRTLPKNGAKYLETLVPFIGLLLLVFIREHHKGARLETLLSYTSYTLEKKVFWSC